MLSALRRGALSLGGKIFLSLAAIAVVAGLGFGGYFGGIGQRIVLAVGSAEISAQAFQLALQRQLNALSQQLGTPLSLEQARLFGLDQQVLSQLASSAALDSEAKRLSLGVSDGHLAQRIASDPIFLQTGGFDRQFFAQVLRSYGITEDDFVDDTRALAARQQLGEGLVGGMTPSQTMLEVANIYANEQRTVSFLTLDEASLGERAAPTREELQAFYTERAGDYRAPEFRAIDYMVLEVESLADPDAVSADLVAESFETVREQLASQGERSITQLLFQDVTQASAAQERLANGQSLADLQADGSFEIAVTELGSVQRSAVLDPAAGDAAFALEAPGPTAVIEGRFGSVIMLVNAISEAGAITLADIEDQIRREIAFANANQEIVSLFEAIEDARAGGDPLAQIATRFGLEIVSVDALDANGFGRDGAPVDLPETRNLIAETFESDVGLENNAVDTADGGYLWYEVTRVEEARDLTFEEAQSRIADDWASDQLDAMLRARGDELVGELNRGRTLQTLSIALDLPITTTAPFTRGEAPDALGGPATVAAFEGPEGHIGAVEGPPNEDGETLTRLVFVVDDVVRPAFFEGASDVQELAEQLAPALEGTVLTQYVSGLQAQLGVSVNQELVGQLLSGGGAHGAY